MGVTVFDVAERCQLAASTVRDILGRNAHRYRPGTVERVREAASALGYRPNSAARAMAKGRFGAVGLLVQRSATNRPSLLPTAMLDGLEQEASRRGLSLLIARIGREGDDGREVEPSILQQSVIDGLILPPEVPASWADPKAQRIPAVRVNAKLESDCVYPDEAGAVAESTRMLAEAGCRTIVYACYNNNPHFSSADRRDGYLAAMKELGSEPRFVTVPKGAAQADWRALSAGWLKDLARPAGVVCYGSDTALAILYAASQLPGIVLPRDLRIISFVHGQVSDFTALPMAFWHVPQVEMGVEAIRMVCEKIEHPDVILPARRVSYNPEWRHLPPGWF